MDKADVSIMSICPSLDDYYKNHNEHNLRNLCLNMQEFFLSVYSTLESAEEKEMLFNSIKRIHELCSIDCNQNENVV